MENLENKAPSSVEFNQLQAQYESLHNLVVLVLVLLVIVSGTLSLCLARLARTSHTQFDLSQQELETVRPQVGGMVSQFQHNKPAMDKFVQDLTDYGQTHPDFAQLLVAKYGIKPGAAGPTSAPPSTVPAPGKTGAPPSTAPAPGKTGAPPSAAPAPAKK